MLTAAGFDVILSVDCSLARMEEDLRRFKHTIVKGDVALFFYAGHGVQVDGQNYLLPVDNGNIQESGELRRRAVNAEEYVVAMADGGARLSVIMLDACRDNPLPSEKRSAGRGLAVMSASRSSETVIVFATKEGEVASDGGGRNSAFTEAFLSTVQTPDLDVMNLFNQVGAKVRRDAGERQLLEIEEQKQQALLAAQRLKAENLSRELERIEAEAASSRPIP